MAPRTTHLPSSATGDGEGLVALRAADESWRKKSRFKCKTKRMERKLDKKSHEIVKTAVDNAYGMPWVKQALGDLADERLKVESLQLYDSSYNMTGRVVDRSSRLHCGEDERGRNMVFDGNTKRILWLDTFSPDQPLGSINLIEKVGVKNLDGEVSKAVDAAVEPHLDLEAATSGFEGFRLMLGTISPEKYVAQANLRRERLAPKIEALRGAAQDASELRFWPEYIAQLQSRIDALTDDLASALAGSTSVDMLTKKWATDRLPAFANRYTAEAMARRTGRNPDEVLASLTKKLVALPAMRIGYTPTSEDRALVEQTKSEAVFRWPRRSSGPAVRSEAGLQSAQDTDWGRRKIEFTDDEVVVRQTRADQLDSVARQIAGLAPETLQQIGAPKLRALNASMKSYARLFDEAQRSAPELAEAVRTAEAHLALEPLYGSLCRRALQLDAASLHAQAFELKKSGLSAPAAVAAVLSPISEAHLEFVAALQSFGDALHLDPKLGAHVDVLDEVDTALCWEKMHLCDALLGSLVLVDFLETVGKRRDLDVSMHAHARQLDALQQETEIPLDEHAALIVPTLKTAKAYQASIEEMIAIEVPKSQQAKALEKELEFPKAYFRALARAVKAVPRLSEAVSEELPDNA